MLRQREDSVNGLNVRACNGVSSATQGQFYVKKPIF